MSSNGIYPALSGAVAQSQALDNVSNNLANVSTTGFRAQRLNFREVLSRAQPARAKNDQRFVQIGTAQSDPAPGLVRPTEQPGDVALSGPGLLAVRTPAGERYVRSATLSRDGTGRLRTATGQEVLGADGNPIVLADGGAGALSIGRRGELFVQGRAAAQLRVVEFPRPQALGHAGNDLYVANGASGAPTAAQATEVLDQHLEAANVSPLRAMTEVISTARQYEALHRVIETFREVDSAAARDLASIS